MLLAALLACTPDEPALVDPTVAGDPGVNGRIEAHGDRDVLYLWGTRREMGFAEACCRRARPSSSRAPGRRASSLLHAAVLPPARRPPR